MMEKYSIGYNQLLDFPYEQFLEFGKIISLENREEKKRQERAQEKSEANL